MPVYVFVCNECEHKFERIIKINEYKIPKCPECKGKCYQKIQPAGIKFIGSFPGEDLKKGKKY